METRIESLGAYLPARIQSTDELIASMANPPQFNLEEITGIRNRRVHGPDETTFTIAVRAARDALSRSRYKPEELDIVVSTSISRSKDDAMVTFEPCLAGAIAREIGAHAAIHFDLANACAGMMTGVLVLDRMIKAGLVRRGLVVSGEAITPIAVTAAREITAAWDPQFGSLTVGDSGVALVIDPAAVAAGSDRIHYVELVTSCEYSSLCIGEPCERRAGLALYTNNPEMHKKERVQLWPMLQRDFLASRGTTFEQERYDFIIQHQVGTRAIVNFTRLGGAMFGAKMPPSLEVVAELGNTATTSHFLVLHQMLAQGRVPRGSKILMVPAASGLVTGCMSTTIRDLEV